MIQKFIRNVFPTILEYKPRRLMTENNIVRKTIVQKAYADLRDIKC